MRSMRLHVNGQIVADPTPDDIARAIDAAPRSEDWSLTLERSEEDYVDAYAADGELIVLTTPENGGEASSTPLAPDVARHILAHYLVGDEGWRGLASWKKWEPPGAASTSASAVKATGSLPIALASIFGLMIVAIYGQQMGLVPALPLPPPLHTIGAQSMLFFAAAAVTAFGTIAVAKFLEVRRAAGWPSAPGRILRSELRPETRGQTDGPQRLVMAPSVEYEFVVTGRTYRGTRISIGEDVGGGNAEATLKRFPAGASVTVFHDPQDPQNCVLDRSGPASPLLNFAILLASVAVILGVGYIVATQSLAFVRAHRPEASAPLVVFAFYFGLITLVAFLMLRRAAKTAERWPTAMARVLESSTETFETFHDGRSRSYVAPRVEYEYQLAGRSYRSRQITLNTTVSGSAAMARRIAARYPAGRMVKIRYNPENPAEACLETRSWTGWIFFVVAVVAFAGAAVAAGLLRLW